VKFLETFLSIMFCLHRNVRILRICWVGLLVYIFVLSEEVNRVYWLMLTCIRSSIKCTVFLMLKAYGSML
jgi:hypothetical protein